jgi:hypothetical protein
MTEQVPSDFLTRIRRDAEHRLPGGYICELDPNDVLALVECAEVLRDLRYTPPGDQPMEQADAFWARVHAAVDKLEAL